MFLIFKDSNVNPTNGARNKIKIWIYHPGIFALLTPIAKFPRPAHIKHNKNKIKLETEKKK